MAAAQQVQQVYNLLRRAPRDLWGARVRELLTYFVVPVRSTMFCRQLSSGIVCTMKKPVFTRLKYSQMCSLLSLLSVIHDDDHGGQLHCENFEFKFSVHMCALLSMLCLTSGWGHMHRP